MSACARVPCVGMSVCVHVGEYLCVHMWSVCVHVHTMSMLMCRCGVSMFICTCVGVHAHMCMSAGECVQAASVKSLTQPSLWAAIKLAAVGREYFLFL